ncbi:MAG: hypothetical protein GC180_00440 [Bacteroidetes bacterium]|nr:hypothetical protein [Bacteroidota bacterium]
MKKYIIFFLLLTGAAACQNKKPSTRQWIDDSIKTYLKNSENPVTTLYSEGETKRNWTQIENVDIDNVPCVQYEIRLTTDEHRENPGHLLATSFIAFDTIHKIVYETDFETGEFAPVK